MGVEEEVEEPAVLILLRELPLVEVVLVVAAAGTLVQHPHFRVRHFTARSLKEVLVEIRVVQDLVLLPLMHVVPHHPLVYILAFQVVVVEAE